MTNWPTASPTEMAWIDADAMREIDRQMVDELGVVLLQMMENAGRSLAAVVRAEHDPSTVAVLAGPGGNGGGGLVAARHLHNAGVGVQVVLTTNRERFTEVAAHQLGIVDRLGIPVVDAAHFDAAHFDATDVDVIVDAMVGYSLSGALRGTAAELALAVAASSTPVISLDVPSGLSSDPGSAVGGVVADATVTLCLPKVGLRDRTEVGRLFVADISVPATMVQSVTGGPAPPFDRGPIVLVQ